MGKLKGSTFAAALTTHVKDQYNFRPNNRLVICNTQCILIADGYQWLMIDQVCAKIYC